MSGRIELNFSIEKYTYITEDDINLSFLPPMARRKLSVLDKIALTAMHNCFTDNDIKLVFASRYGELERLKKLVAQYTEENEVSPSAFSGSVHNSAVGQFSLINQIKESYNSISAEKNTFSAGLFEAVASAKTTNVLYCCCDTEPYIEGFACSLSLSDANAHYILNINKNPDQQNFSSSETERFMDFLKSNAKEFTSNDGLITIRNVGE